MSTSPLSRSMGTFHFLGLLAPFALLHPICSSLVYLDLSTLATPLLIYLATSSSWDLFFNHLSSSIKTAFPRIAPIPTALLSSTCFIGLARFNRSFTVTESPFSSRSETPIRNNEAQPRVKAATWSCSQCQATESCSKCHGYDNHRGLRTLHPHIANLEIGV